MFTPGHLMEIGSFLIGIFFLLYLWRENRYHALGFIAAILTTIIIEFTGIRMSHTYYYSPVDFWVMLGSGDDGFPLCIAVDWALIMFCSIRLGSRLECPAHYLPFIYAILAVSIDLMLDPVASVSRIVATSTEVCTQSGLQPGSAEGLGFWVWCVPPSGVTTYLGVPYSNFYAWCLVIISFSSVFLISEKRVLPSDPSLLQQVFAVIGVIVLSYVCFGILVKTFMALESYVVSGRVLFLVLFSLGLIALWRAGTAREKTSLDWLAMIMLLSGIVFCAGVYFLTDLHNRVGTEFRVTMLVVGVFALCLYVYTNTGWPFNRKGNGQAASS